MSTERPGAGPYAPPPDDYEMFDARDAEQDRRGWLVLLAAAVVFALFMAVVWNAFQLGVRERSDSPVILADAEPFRVAPEDPGGFQTPNQDLSAYELRRRNGERAGRDEADGGPAPVRPGAEEPVARPERLPPVQVEAADADALDAPPEALPEPAPESAPESAQDRTPAEPAAPARSETAPAPSGRAQGAFVVQIGAYRAQEEAEAGWLAFVSRHSDMTSGRGPDIQRADLGDRGVFHRLRVAGFETREEAAAYCASLDARGQSCLVARR
ncbi:SPOR domain-containing protein [Alkalicaulis satelles]|nr:SPOR domain-containing protein [Alkalicaulis satelles]